MAEKKRRVAVIGGGAAGVSAAWSLARSLKEDVEVTIVEPCGSLGGVACTKRLKNGQLGERSSDDVQMTFVVFCVKFDHSSCWESV